MADITYNEVKERLAEGAVLISRGGPGGGYQFPGGTLVGRSLVWQLIRDGWARPDPAGRVVAETPENKAARDAAANEKIQARKQKLRDARLDRWADWMLSAADQAARRAVAERIALQAMSLGGLDDDVVILDGDPPRDK